MRQETEAGEKWSENQKLYFRLNLKFKESIELAKTSGNHTDEELEAGAFSTIGAYYDEEFEQEAETPISELKGFQSFTDRAKKEEEGLNKQKSKDEKFEASFKAGSVPAERAISFFLLEKAKGAEEIAISKGKIDYQVCWILDAIAHVFIEAQLKSEKEKGEVEEPRALISSEADLIKIANRSIELRESNQNEFKDKGIMLSITDSEIKKIIEKKNLSNKRISELVVRLSDIVLTGKYFQFWDVEKGTFIDIEKEISMPLLTTDFHRPFKRHESKEPKRSAQVCHPARELLSPYLVSQSPRVLGSWPVCES